MKYIMFENELGHKIPVIFPDKIVHADMAKSIAYMMVMQNDEFVKPVSSGLVSIKAKVSGKSKTLNLESNDDDSMYITFNDSIGSLPLDIMPPTILKELRDQMKKDT